MVGCGTVCEGLGEWKSRFRRVQVILIGAVGLLRLQDINTKNNPREALIMTSLLLYHNAFLITSK
jgi:hypothetical protein